VVRLIAWNVARRVSVLAEQAAAVGERAPDVLALQEVTVRTLPLLGLPPRRRLDHVFCSSDLEPVACAYHHGWRDAGLSDHSALEADLR
jgi:endonuclease/exonuclease/phosphatase family metal-dependent hydrolase